METRQLDHDFSYEVTCPIGQDIMVDPVNTIPCGHCFERESITEWTKSHSTCPICVQPVERQRFVPNVSLRGIIEKLLTLYPENLFSGDFVNKLIKDGKKELVLKIFSAHPNKINDVLIDGYNALQLAVIAGKLDIIKALFENFPELDINKKAIHPGQANHGRTATFIAAYHDAASIEILDFLLKKGGDPKLATAKGENAILVSLWNEVWDRAKLLLASGKDLGINQKVAVVPKDITPLICGVQKNCDIDLFKSILEVPEIDVNAALPGGETALFLAAEKGQEEKVKALLAMPQIDPEPIRTQDGTTAMQAASHHPDIFALFTSPEVRFKIIKKKIDAGLTKEAAELFAEIYKDGSPQSLAYLLEIGERGNHFEKFWQHLVPKILLRAVEKEDTLFILSLFKFFPEQVNTSFPPGYTALQYMAKNNKLKLMREFLNEFKSVDLNLRATIETNVKGATALLIAIPSEKPSGEMTTYLLQQGADPAIPNINGTTPLIAAVSSKNKESLHALLVSGKKLNPNQPVNQPLVMPEKKGSTALIVAAGESDIDIFTQLLMIEDLNINLKNASGESALFIAAASGDEAKVKLLLSLRGIDIYARRNNGQTAAEAAELNGHHKIAAILSFYHLMNVMLSGAPLPPKLKLDYISHLDEKSLTLICQRITDLGHPENLIRKLMDFFFELKEKELDLTKEAHTHGFFNDEKLRQQQMKILDKLFNIAHQNYFNNRLNWEKKVRDTALDELKETIESNPTEKNIAFGQWARSQTIFSQHRHFLSLGRTNAQKEIDNTVYKTLNFKKS